MRTSLRKLFVKLQRSLNRMRMLLLHPESDPEAGSWIHERWDRVVDMGVAGEQARARWSKIFRCPVEHMPEFEIEDFAAVRRALDSGLGLLVDEHGLDWWELTSVRFHEQIVLTLRLQKLLGQLDPNDTLFVSHAGLSADTIRLLCGRSVRCFGELDSRFRQARRALQTARKFSCAQLVEIFGDKYDAGYQIRRLTAREPPRFNSPVVLMPVAQGNAARTAIAYAAMLPDQQFLLVATRQSGWISVPSENVTGARLASYATANSSVREHRHLLARWPQVESRLEANREVSKLRQLGFFAGIRKLLSDGLAIRNAWLQLFEREPVSAVFCTDDTNPYTNIPLLLARQRGLRTIACHHGALDGGHLVKRSHADVLLAKGRMEEDYLVNTCGVPREKVDIGAPLLASRPMKISAKNLIIFFSEPYELAGVRCREFYGELLPPLADLALQTHRKLVVKLHPMESARQRRKLVNAALSPQHQKNARIVEGPLSEELLERAWFAVTLQSTAAVDCTLRGIPVFLCAWLDYSHYGYLDQFIRFHAGMPLRSPSEIASIPSRLEQFSAADAKDLWHPMFPGKLQQLLTEPSKMAVAV
jgi:hypothetical protein